MYILDIASDGVITLVFRSYAWAKEVVLSPMQSAVLRAKLSMAGKYISGDRKDVITIAGQTTLGAICRSFLIY